MIYGTVYGTLYGTVSDSFRALNPRPFESDVQAIVRHYENTVTGLGAALQAAAARELFRDLLGIPLGHIPAGHP